MGEVYWGCYERCEHLCCLIGSEAVGSPQAVQLPPGWEGPGLSGVGSGFAAYAQGLSRCAQSLAQVYPLMRPRAREIVQLAVLDGENAAVNPEEAQPMYLRDEVAVVPNQGVTTVQSRN